MSNGSVIWTDHHGNKSNADGQLDSLHRFERVGLGKAPFRVVGYGREVYQAVPGDPSCPLQPGTSCDYCGTGIMDVAYVESADGKRFKVGCDCVAKAGDDGLLTAIRRSPQYRDLQRQKRHAKDVANKAEIDKLLADPRLPELRRENYGYRLGWCGAAGRARVLRELRDELCEHN